MDHYFTHLYLSSSQVLLQKVLVDIFVHPHLALVLLRLVDQLFDLYSLFVLSVELKRLQAEDHRQTEKRNDENSGL